jgi:hypothetical protein
VRPNGLLVLLAVVVTGMGSSVVFWRWQASKQIEAAAVVRESVPAGGEARLDTWLETLRPMIHARLQQLRLDAARPWLVTHVVEPSSDPAQHEIWGVDLTGLGPEVTRREGMTVVVELPAARLLGPGPLSGDKSVNVPRYRPGTPVADPNERAEFVVEWFLAQIEEGLAGDVEGAALEARVGPSAPSGGSQ